MVPDAVLSYLNVLAPALTSVITHVPSIEGFPLVPATTTVSPTTKLWVADVVIVTKVPERALLVIVADLDTELFLTVLTTSGRKNRSEERRVGKEC
jgi:hypothetical protein